MKSEAFEEPPRQDAPAALAGAGNKFLAVNSALSEGISSA